MNTTGEESTAKQIEAAIETALAATPVVTADASHASGKVQIELVDAETIPGTPNTAESIKALAARRRDIRVTYDGHPILRLGVPQSVFNPYQTVAAPIIVEQIINGTIALRGKRVVDLGCGCGILGMAARLAGCAGVLYTDINPRVVDIAGHELFRAGIDRVVVQDMCANERPASADIVLVSFPSVRVSGSVAAGSIESAYCRGDEFIPRLVDSVASVLVARGALVFFYRAYHDRLGDFVELLTRLGSAFDLGSLNTLWRRAESNRTACLFSITRSDSG